MTRFPIRVAPWISSTALAVLLASCSEGSSNSDGSSGAPGEDEDACCTLGAVCHIAGEAPADVEECHQIGHTGDQAECRREYDRCFQLCEGVTDNPVPHACQ